MLKNEAIVNTEVINLVNNILHEKFELPLEKLTPTAHLKDDLNLDSLDFVDMVVLIEDKYSMGIKDFDFMKVHTLGDIYNLVQNLKSEETPAAPL